MTNDNKNSIIIFKRFILIIWVRNLKIKFASTCVVYFLYKMKILLCARYIISMSGQSKYLLIATLVTHMKFSFYTVT